MNNLHRILAGAALLLTLAAGMTSCGSTLTLSGAATSKKINSLKRGMTMEEVRNMLGTPTDKLLIDGRETWRYERTNVLTAETKVIEVGFIGNSVEYINTYDK